MSVHPRSLRSLSIVLLSTALASVASAEPSAPPYGLPALSRADFNRLAAREGVPLFWAADAGVAGVPEPAELVPLGVLSGRNPFVADGALTPAFEKAYRGLVEARRVEAVRLELDQGLPTLVRTDLSRLSRAEKAMVRHVLRAADRVAGLFARQSGAAGLGARVPSGSPESAALFDRNQGPWCAAPKTENDPFCNALPDFPSRRWDPYPADAVQDLALCRTLAAQPNAGALLDPFTVVRRFQGEWAALPLTAEYGEAMRAVAEDLDLAARAAKVAGEKAFARYLSAAAQGFRTNDWAAADEAWAAMNARNSRWYLRIGPDETYWDLCQAKAGFHVSFARIDRGSLELQDRLSRLRTRMERSLGDIAPAYRPRDVRFAMPDFIEIVVNAGNSKSPLGATIGQSLPNWGRVATEGRGRTVVMTNLYTDPDSRAMSREKAARMLDDATMADYTDDRRVALLDIILHEATHNLGPHSDYRIDGKDPRAVFGGQIATVLEELKAQTGSWFYTELLREAGVITDAEARQIYVHALVWSFGHLSQGLFSPSGNPKPYSQLSAIQVGFLVDRGALTWEESVDPASGQPVGKFRLHFERVSDAARDLMAEVVRIKASGDVAAARALIDPYVVGDRAAQVRQPEIAARLLGFPKGTLVYAVDLGSD